MVCAWCVRRLVGHSLSLRWRRVATPTTAAATTTTTTAAAATTTAAAAAAIVAADAADAAAVTALLLHHPRDAPLECHAAAHRLNEALEALT